MAAVEDAAFESGVRRANGGRAFIAPVDAFQARHRQVLREELSPLGWIKLSAFSVLRRGGARPIEAGCQFRDGVPRWESRCPVAWPLTAAGARWLGLFW